MTKWYSMSSLVIKDITHYSRSDKRGIEKRNGNIVLSDLTNNEMAVLSLFSP